MKTKIFLSLFVLFIVACNQDKIDELSQKNQELDSTTIRQDSVINEMLGSFNEIQANLNAIKEREGYIGLNASSEEISQSNAEQINKDIALISELMKSNEQLIAQLNNQLKSSKVKMSEFRKLIENLNQQLADKNLQIAKLNDALANKDIKINDLYFSIDSLKYNNRQKDKVIQEKIDEMNEAYYAYGTFKELNEKGVLDKEGGFLGLGKSEALKDDFNKDYFSKIDKTKQKSFLIYAKKAELVSTHPKSSYEFKKTGNQIDSLVVLDVDAFWSTSNYMVVLIE